MKPKILIIDDESSILHALQIFLEQEGFSVQANDKYNNILERSEDNELPDLVILDILLMEEDGRMISKKLKENPRTSHIPIILISAHPTAYKTAKHSKADAFLPKPFNPTVLLDTIERLTKSKLNAQL
jgi:DNA-binding response OmpR family regulator